MVRQACEGCHLSESADKNQQIDPPINVNWFSDNYYNNLHQSYTSVDPNKQGQRPLVEHINSVLDVSELPVPFGQGMPYARKPLDKFSLECEKLIVYKSATTHRKLKFSEIFECGGQSYKSADPNSLGCKCAKLITEKDKLFKIIYKRE